MLRNDAARSVFIFVPVVVEKSDRCFAVEVVGQRKTRHGDLNRIISAPPFPGSDDRVLVTVVRCSRQHETSEQDEQQEKSYQPVTMRGAASYIHGSTLYQDFWRGQQGWSRSVPINGNLVEWRQASDWDGP